MKGLMELGGKVCSGLIPHVATHCSRPFGRYSEILNIVRQFVVWNKTGLKV
jgi:hypothetical protein